MNLRYKHVYPFHVDVQFIHIQGIYLLPPHIFEEAAKPGGNCGKKHRRGFDHTTIFAPDRNVLDQNLLIILSLSSTWNNYIRDQSVGPWLLREKVKISSQHSFYEISDQVRLLLIEYFELWHSANPAGLWGMLLLKNGLEGVRLLRRKRTIRTDVLTIFFAVFPCSTFTFTTP